MGVSTASLRMAFDAHTATVSSELDYAAVHITGRQGENPMAARPFLGIGADTPAFLVQALQTHLAW